MAAIMFKKPKRNFRKKGAGIGSDDDAGDGEDNDVEMKDVSIPSTNPPKEKKDKSKSKSKSSVLSFEVDEPDDDDDDGQEGVFKIKKSSTSRRIAKQMKKEKQRQEKESRNGSGNGHGHVSDEGSNEEDEDDHRSSWKSRKAESKEKEKKKRKDTEEEKRKAEEKIRQLREEFRTMNGEEAEAMDSDDDDSQKTFKNMLARGEIPDAKTIHYIRKQRQMARDTDGFIPLEEEEKDSKPTKSTTRLVRDDDNDKSDDDEDGSRIDFSVNQAARDRQQLRDNFLAAEHGSDEESDHDREWEKQQIKKAVSLQIPGVELESRSPQRSNVYFEGSRHERSIAMDSGDQKPFKALSQSQDTSEINIEAVRKRLEERVSTMDSVYRTHKIEYDRTAADLEATTKNEELCRTKVPMLENRYRFFQELRGYVRDLVDCLNEKLLRSAPQQMSRKLLCVNNSPIILASVIMTALPAEDRNLLRESFPLPTSPPFVISQEVVPILQDLEHRVNNLLKMRATRLLQRHQQDVQDQCRDYMTSKASVKVDEEDSQQQLKQRRVADREARRSRRRRVRDTKSVTGHHDGFSSDDEESSQSQVLKFNSELEDISQTKENLFSDVVADFADIEVVKENFERWKFKYTDTYQEAYIGLCMPKLLNPFIRIELLTWNPFDDDCQDFEESRWFNILVFMGFKEGTDMPSSDDDSRILPYIVEKVVVPKITFLVENVWDPMSTKQTSHLVNLISRLIQDYPTIHADNKNFRALMEAVVSRMKRTLDDDVFMPMYPISVLDNRLSGPAIFFHRQSWSSIKLLGNMLSWHQVLSESILKKLAFSGLLNRYIVVGLVNSHINREALQKCKVIISTLPKEWFASLDGDATLPQLENLCRYLVGAAETLHKASALESDKGRQEGRELVKQISKHLVNIHAMDHAMSLANRFSFALHHV